MDISIVIPTYQRPALLRRCLDALSRQILTDETYEVIVVSDGFDAATARMIALFKKTHPDFPLSFYATSTHSGPAAARNFGWRHAHAELIAFTDDDCIPDSRWVASLLMSYRSSNKPYAVFTGRTHVPISDRPTDYERNIAYLERAEFITANCACTKNVLTLVDGFDERFKMAWREDTDLQFKLMENDIPIIVVATAHVIHPVRKHRWTDYLRDERKGLFNALLYKKYPKLYKAKIQKHGPLNYYFIAATLIATLGGALLGSSMVTWLGFFFWSLTTVLFIIKRLRNTSHALEHVGEMIVTSIVIPPVSLYWRWYGAVKYKVWIP
jgi:glycosyltransferase involved in cell wall biosynthesis